MEAILDAQWIGESNNHQVCSVEFWIENETELTHWDIVGF